MPIKLNGTTINNGGTVTFNGNNVTEIVWSSGGSNYTVWKAEQYILNGNDKVTSVTGGWAAGTETTTAKKAGSSTSSGIKCDATVQSNAAMFTNNTIDLTNYSTITVTYDITNTSGSAGYNNARGYGILLASSRNWTYSAPDNTSAPAWGTSKQYYVYMSHTSFKNNTATSSLTYDNAIANTGTNKSFTINISSLTGSYYVGVISAASHGPDQRMNILFKTIKLS